MAFTIGAIGAYTNDVLNPFSFAHTVNPDETLLVVLMKVVGTLNRSGGALTYGGKALTQAGTTQKAASAPEASAELWYLTNPRVGTATLVIPNEFGTQVGFRIVAAKTPRGYGSVLNAVSGANATATNPASSLTISVPDTIAFAVVATGAQTWAPSARTGTLISDHDDGAQGAGFQYLISVPAPPVPYTQAMGWTFATSDDWGTCAAAFEEQPPLNLQNYMGGSVVGSGVSVSERTPFH